MGTFTGGSLDFASISTEMGRTTKGWMNATVQIIDPNVSDTEWNEWTNSYTGGEPTVIWQGSARIQHLKSEKFGNAGYAEIGIRGIRIQVPLDFNMGFIRKGLQVVVIDGGVDVELEQLQFIVTSAVNSSYAWLRTIECEVDVKSIANSTWSSITGTVMSATLAPIANATVRTFSHKDNLWLLEYETTTDSLGNYRLPADPSIPVAVVASHSSYITKYYNNVSSFSVATLLTPVNHVDTSNIDFVLVGV
jgi:hypothetical protein